MDSDAVLLEWYEGELRGESLFWTLAQSAAASFADKWLALAQLESHVAAKLLATLARRGIAAADPDAVLARSEHDPCGVAKQPWDLQMRWLEDVAQNALDDRQRAAAHLPLDLAPIARLVVAHEAVLVSFARLELAGLAADAMRGVDECIAAIRGV